MTNVIEDYIVIPVEHLEQITTEWFARHFAHATREEDKYTAGYARAYSALYDLKTQLSNSITKPQPLDLKGNQVQLIPTASIEAIPVTDAPAVPAVEAMPVASEEVDTAAKTKGKKKKDDVVPETNEAAVAN